MVRPSRVSEPYFLCMDFIEEQKSGGIIFKARAVIEGTKLAEVRGELKSVSTVAFMSPDFQTVSEAEASLQQELTSARKAGFCSTLPKGLLPFRDCEISIRPVHSDQGLLRFETGVLGLRRASGAIKKTSVYVSSRTFTDRPSADFYGFRALTLLQGVGMCH